MKRKIGWLLVLALIHTGIVKAQNDTDSLPFIRLSEITVNSTLKDINAKVKDFVIANGNASTEDILSRLPEINMIRRGSYGMEPQIRSYQSGQINLMVDGMRIHGACTDKMDPPTIYIEPQNLDEIKISSTHGSQYGSTLGGTINLQLATPALSDDPTFSSKLSSGYQSASKAFYESAFVQYTSSRWAIRANATYRNASDYRSGGGKVIPYSSNEKINYGVSAVHRLKSLGILKLDILFDDAWYIGYPALQMDVGGAKARIFSIGTQGGHFRSNWKQIELKLYANTISHTMDDTHRSHVLMHMDMPGISETVGGYASAVQQLSKRTEIKWRWDASTTFLKASMTMYPPSGSVMYMLTWPNNRMLQSGLSALIKHRLDSLNTLNIGVRADYYNYWLTSVSAKNQLSVLDMPVSAMPSLLKNISVEWQRKIHTSTRLAASVEYDERVPTASEYYGFYLFNAKDNYDYLGNTRLKHESALRADVKFSHIRKRIHFGLNFYVSNIHHYIMGTVKDGYTAMTPGAAGVKQYENLQQAFLAGTELAVMVKPYAGWQWLSTMKWNYGSDQHGHALPLISPFRMISSIRKEITNFSVQAEMETAAKQNRVSTEAGEQKTPSFCLFHFRASYKFLAFHDQHCRIDAGVENIFDRNYYEHLDWNKIPRAGRNVYVMLTWNL